MDLGDPVIGRRFRINPDETWQEPGLFKPTDDRAEPLRRLRMGVTHVVFQIVGMIDEARAGHNANLTQGFSRRQGADPVVKCRHGESADRATEETGSDGSERRRRVVRPWEVSYGGGFVRRGRAVPRAVRQGQTGLLGRLPGARRVPPQGRQEGPRQGSLPARPRRLPQEGRPAGHEKNRSPPSDTRLIGDWLLFDFEKLPVPVFLLPGASKRHLSPSRRWSERRFRGFRALAYRRLATP